MSNAIEVTGVSKTYKNYKLSDVTFGVPKGLHYWTNWP